MSRNPCENAITKALVDRLDDDMEARSRFYCDYQFVPIEWGPGGEMMRDQYIDLAVIVNNDRRKYLAYECKKLNVLYHGVRRSQAGRYVGKEGMMRFVIEKYAKDLPVGCMLGYVMDGDLSRAYTSIAAAMASSTAELGLQGQPVAAPHIGMIDRFVTEHVCGARWLELRHALLPFV